MREIILFIYWLVWAASQHPLLTAYLWNVAHRAGFRAGANFRMFVGV